VSKLRALLALVLLLAGAGSLRTQEQPTLRVHFIDVGQGDAVLIQSPSGQNVLYDAGENATRVRDYLSALGVTEVGLVIASHNHADHIGGLPEVLRTYRPMFYIDNGVPATTQTYARVLEAAREAGSQLLEPTARRITLGDAALVVVPPPGVAAWDQNDNSVGIVIEYGTFRLSLGGDAEPRQWSWWLIHQPEPLQEMQVHKASHHGSINGDTADGLARLSPEAVVVGVGTGNSYGHPDAAALQLYTQQRAAVYRTDVNGTVIVEAQASGAYTVRVERGEGAQPPPQPTPTPSPTPAPTPAPTPTPAPKPTPAPPSAPPTTWQGPLPTPTLVSGRPTCSASLFPPVASCVNEIVGAPTAVCRNGRFSCSTTASGTCSGNGGVQCWKCPGQLC
jgi:competence protein ComEC